MTRKTWVLALLVVARLATAQATTTVPPGARVYRDIERLGALGLIDTLLMGARPYSERDITRMLLAARAHVDRNPAASEWAERVIQGDLAHYGVHENRPFDAAQAEAVLLDSPFRPAPSDPNGVIDATINPLAANRGGRPIADGSTLGVETWHSATLGPYVAAAIAPRVTFLDWRGGGASSVHASIQAGELSALVAGLSLEVGRAYTVFGQSSTGGLLFSPSGPPLDMVRLSNDVPWTVPLVSRILGPLRGELLVADLGTREIHPHSKLVGYHLAALPHPQFELGVEVIDAMGGAGGPPASFGDRVLDAIPIFDALRTGSDFQFSNKIAGVDARWRMPRWAGFELYLEGDVDDFDPRRLRSSLLEDGGYLAGMSFSCLVSCGALSVRAEYHQTGIRYYTHNDYPIESRGQLLGDPLGPRGIGAYLDVDDDLGARGTLSLEGAFEIRSGNLYGSDTTGARDAGFHFVQTVHRPGEKRWRGLVTWTARDAARIAPRISGGIERVSNYAFVAGAARTNAIGEIGLAVRP
ncbi:MAG: capsule assembly Wzi family protein [Gemmatimonadaceae bacterium]